MDFDLAEATARMAYLPPGLMAHCCRTSQLCRELAGHWGEAPGRAAWVGLVHDLARPYPEGKLLYQARKCRLPINEIEEAMPLLLHGPVGAEVLKRNWRVGDEEVLEAVRWHTTGNTEMGRLAKIVFLADKLEPGKSELYPHMGPVRRLAWQNLDKALLEFFNSQIASLLQGGSLIHPAMAEARDSLQGQLT